MKAERRHRSGKEAGGDGPDAIQRGEKEAVCRRGHPPLPYTYPRRKEAAGAGNFPMRAAGAGGCAPLRGSGNCRQSKAYFDALI